MQTLRILETVHIIESALVGHMYTDTPVETQHKELQVVANAYACAQRHVLQQILHLQLRPFTIAVVAHCPYVAGIYKECSIQIAEQTRTILHIGLKLYIARLVHIRQSRLIGVVTARTNAAHIEGTYAVGTAHIELLTVWSCTGIAVRPYHACIDMTHQLAVVRHLPRLAIVGLYLQELSVWVLEHRLSLLVPLLSARQIAKRQQIGSLAHRHLPIYRIAEGRARLISERIAHLRHKLVGH